MGETEEGPTAPIEAIMSRLAAIRLPLILRS
jgi:hypothetical protein